MAWDRDLTGRLRALTVLGALALALGATACGSDDDGGDAAAQGDGGSVREQVTAAYKGYHADLGEGRYEEACARLSDSYAAMQAKQVALMYPNVKGGKPKTCPEAFEALFQQGGVRPSDRPVVGVKTISPTRADAIVQLNLPGKQGRTAIAFVKEGDEWKFQEPQKIKEDPATPAK